MTPERFNQLFPKTDDPEEAAFTAWIAKVDAWLVKKICLESADLIDMNYRDMFEDGVTPAAAGRAALKNEGYNG
jgi:hypothetical protein